MAKQNQRIEKNNKPIIKKGNTFLFIIIVFCTPVLLYIQTITYGFTHFDDDVIISNNYEFLNKTNNIPQAFLTNAFIQKGGTFYRPLQTISYIIDTQFSNGNNAWMYHLSNILLWGLIAVALYLFLKRFLLSPILSLISTIGYCVHPLFVSTVAWIPARGDLILTLFTLISFVYLFKYQQNNKLIYLISHWVTFTLALFCKETAIILPVLYILYFICFSENLKFKKHHLALASLYLLSGIVWFLLRSKAIGTFSDQIRELGIASILSNTPSFFESLSKIFIPFDFSPIPEFTAFKIITGIIICCSILVFFFKNKNTTKSNLFFLSWFIVLMLPPLIYKHPLIDYLDHRFFLPLIGILAFSASTLPSKWTDNYKLNKSWLPISFILLLSGITFTKTKYYSNSVSFYNAAVKENPKSAIAFHNRGYEKSLVGDNIGAIDDFNKAIANSPNYYHAYCSRGISKLNIGNYVDAISDFDSAIRIHPNYAEAYNSRANAKNYIHQFKESINDYTTAISINPQYFNAYNNRGIVKASINDNQGAIDDYTNTIALNPSYAEAYYNRGSVRAKLNDNLGAISDFNKAIEINPKYEDAYINKGIAMIISGNSKAAITCFDKAIEINPQSIEAYGNRAITNLSIKDYVSVIKDCEILLRFNSKDERVLNLMNQAQQELNKLHHYK